MRLFVAIALPPPILAALTALAPHDRGIRAVPADQMHLTVHFLGDADSGRVIAALDGIAAAPFGLVLGGVGSFRSRDGGAILWVGVPPTPGLQELHSALSSRLPAAGVRVERRPYRPHVTIARCRGDAPRAAIGTFLDRHRHLHVPAFPVDGFTLFASTLTPAGAVHRVERSWALRR